MGSGGEAIDIAAVAPGPAGVTVAPGVDMVSRLGEKGLRLLR